MKILIIVTYNNEILSVKSRLRNNEGNGIPFWYMYDALPIHMHVYLIHTHRHTFRCHIQGDRRYNT